MEKKVKLTENELKTMIAEAICKILKEGQNDNPSNTHYAVHKPSNTIVFAWDYSGYDTAELRQYSNDYFKQDLVDMGMNPKEITILTRKSCAKRGIDPTDDSCWSNYPLTESIITEIGDTPKGQRAIGAVAGRALQRAKNAGYNKSHKEYKKQLNKYNSYSRKANQTQSNYANQLNGDKDYKDGFEYGKRKAMFEDKYNSCKKRGIDPTDDSCWSNYPMNESIFNEAFVPKKLYDTTVNVVVDLYNVTFNNPELEEWIGDNFDILPSNELNVSLLCYITPVDPGDYWTPPSGGDFEITDMDTDEDGSFKAVIPEEFYNDFLNSVFDYVDENYDRLINWDYMNYYEKPEPDWDDIRKERMLRDFEKNNF